MPETSIETRAVMRALDFQDRIQKRLQKDFGHSVGYEEVGRKEMRSLIRKAVEGDTEAMAEIEKLHAANQYPDGRNPVEDEINLILAERADKVMAGMGEAKPEGERKIEDILGEAEGQQSIEQIMENV